MKNPIASLMQQAQKMQENIKKAQDELAEAQVQGEAGGGLVKVAMTGKKVVRKVSIDESLIKEDRDMLEDLVAAAMNDAVNKANALKEEKMAGLTGGFDLPAGFKMPF
jgi:DNA-binding YbaB/EbfC family protein